MGNNSYCRNLFDSKNKFSYRNIKLKYISSNIRSFNSIFLFSKCEYTRCFKKIIAFSTISQLGYLSIALGLKAYAAAFFHLFSHGFFKATLFLSAGIILHANGDDQDLRRIGGLIKSLPLTSVATLIATISL